MYEGTSTKTTETGPEPANRVRRGLLGAALAAASGVAGAAQQASPSGPNAPRSEFVYDAVVEVGQVASLGDSPWGERRFVPILGGSFAGPGLRGKVLAGGADRQLVRKDGVRQLDVLYELQTDDGAVITVRNKVIIHEPQGASRYAFSAIEFHAPEGRYGWLNRAIFVGTLQSMQPARSAVSVQVYRIV